MLTKEVHSDNRNVLNIFKSNAVSYTKSNLYSTKVLENNRCKEKNTYNLSPLLTQLLLFNLQPPGINTHTHPALT